MPGFTAALQRARPPDILAHDSALWREYIRERCGLCFPDSRLWLLRQCLWERMRLHGTQRYRAYYDYVTTHAAGEVEWQALLEDLLNHETSFFRHTPSFTALTEHVFPELLSTRPQGGTIAMWSAGCATGQEPYSLAMAFLEMPASLATPQAAGSVPAEPHFRVIGSDISPRALHKASCGLYKPYEMRFLPDAYRQRYFTPVADGPSVHYQVGPLLQAVVTFGCVNLHNPDRSSVAPLPYSGGSGQGADVIFCQNVLIYFTAADRLAIVQQLCQRLRPGGYLFLGSADVVGLRLPGIHAVHLPDVLLYQRTR